MSGFTVAIHKKTGDRQRVPSDWLTHPVIGKDYEAVPDETPAPASEGAVTTTGKKVK